MPKIDEYTLLCERCGYVIEGLASGTNCPECGKPICESLPEARPGSPAQRGRSVRTRVLTWFASVRSPVRSFTYLRIEPKDTKWYGRANLLLAALLFGGTNSLLRLATHYLEGGMASDATQVEWSYRATELSLWFGLWSAGSFIVLIALTHIEGYGLLLGSRLRGWRSTRAIAEVVLQHATVGWVIGGALTYAGAALACLWLFVASGNSRARWELTYHSHYLLPIAGGLVGLMIFETLAFFGMRALRYANRAKTSGE